MSTLSNMCDNLRLMARLVRDYDYDVISHELRHAADTIWELRNKLGDLQDERYELRAENAKLREQIVQLQADWESERDYANQMEAKEKRAVSENANLRELAAEAIRLMQANGPDCGICKHYDECWTGEAMDYSPSGCVICNEARELGIEV